MEEVSMSKRSNEVTNKIVKGLSDLARALKNNEPIAETFTCRKVIVDLKPIPYGPKNVKRTRNLLRVSQVLFAQFLGVRPSAVRSWEQGRQEPSTMACRFMDEIQLNPEYYIGRLRESI